MELFSSAIQLCSLSSALDRRIPHPLVHSLAPESQTSRCSSMLPLGKDLLQPPLGQRITSYGHSAAWDASCSKLHIWLQPSLKFLQRMDKRSRSFRMYRNRGFRSERNSGCLSSGHERSFTSQLWMQVPQKACSHGAWRGD